MNTPPIKLETVLVAYVTANYQGAGEPLEGATLYPGHRQAAITIEHRVGFHAGGIGGPHANVGNYEVQLAMEVLTNSNPQPSDTTARLVIHQQRAEALAGIFAESRVATVCAALMALDAELGVSAFWGAERQDDMDGENFRTVLLKTFAVHLV